MERALHVPFRVLSSSDGLHDCVCLPVDACSLMENSNEQLDCLQSMDGSMEVSVLAPRAVTMSASHGDWVRVSGTIVASGPQTTLFLRSSSDAVKVCGMPSRSRRLKAIYGFNEWSSPGKNPHEDDNGGGCSCK